ncbi:hypothetical protein MES4922_70004 [Mesorhizobium ventifaucium]|uniref:HTH lysR-type domain-containing protein n=1 Tax=Mesorhizobium ventifaucium TaxID=666020 RepID=A0ABM9EFC3_9HYPH|nr:hypothetical protein MES4922_70004 [Mesorhizobium ventifaucium]
MNLNRLAYFAAVVDAGSFTRAAERLGITKAVVSQQVARLERDVGTTLLIRTTRRVHPTEAGRTFHARCLQVSAAGRGCLRRARAGCRRTDRHAQDRRAQRLRHLGGGAGSRRLQRPLSRLPGRTDAGRRDDRPGFWWNGRGDPRRLAGRFQPAGTAHRHI